MAITDGQVTPGEDLEEEQEVESARDAWLEVAAVDADLAALATAARRGRPLPRG